MPKVDKHTNRLGQNLSDTQSTTVCKNSTSLTFLTPPVVGADLRAACGQSVAKSTAEIVAARTSRLKKDHVPWSQAAFVAPCHRLTYARSALYVPCLLIRFSANVTELFAPYLIRFLFRKLYFLHKTNDTCCAQDLPWISHYHWFKPYSKTRR